MALETSFKASAREMENIMENISNINTNVLLPPRLFTNQKYSIGFLMYKMGFPDPKNIDIATNLKSLCVILTKLWSK